MIEARLKVKEWGPKAVEYLQRETEKQQEQSKKNSLLWAEYKLKSEGLAEVDEAKVCKDEVQWSMSFAQSFSRPTSLKSLAGSAI